MKVIILAGGLGTRISEETADKPKPMVLLDDKPIIWHVMNIFATQGYRDFVIATGVGATIRDFCEEAFSFAGLDWQEHTQIDERYLRPSEVDALIGDPSKAKNQLNWEATTHWRELARLMVEADMKK